MTITVSSGTITVPASESLSSSQEPLVEFSGSTGTLVNYGVSTLTAGGQSAEGAASYSEPNPSVYLDNNNQFAVSGAADVTGVEFATLNNSGSFSVTSSSGAATGGTGGLINTGIITVQGETSVSAVPTPPSGG